jgi:alanine racemase
VIRGDQRGASEALIDLAALRENFAEASRRAGDREVFAVVKADAYGHGVLDVTRALVAAGCTRFAVANAEEGVALRDADIAAPILVFGGVRDAEEAEVAVARGLTPVIHANADVERLALAAGGRSRPVSVQVEVDTGMHRMGAPAVEAPSLVERVVAEPGLALEGVYTHFARADEPDLAPSLEQLGDFRKVLDAVAGAGMSPRFVHAANSAGLLAGDTLFAALPEVNAVRPGLMLYGVLPGPHLSGALQPVMTLRSRVVALRALGVGNAVGYGALHRASRDTRIATVPLGYADGVPISTSNRGRVLIRGRRLPIVGRVSMDAITVDVADAPVRVGDEVLLFGATEQGALPVEEAAEAADTISYELLVRVGARVPRRYEG